ncbi:uncharacterized protein LOC110854295 [Folsomia candida]|uniref:Uncharacterized protein n=1 Tax=Folsomia candida TaxID=158441 RepID=A0A226DYY5_FOLCA|nr:uncharacterized protein LOC110854295 [Folsomia candida]OXA49947.1 hypothetical protein Fcan01_14836 [Folsomia candida]
MLRNLVLVCVLVGVVVAKNHIQDQTIYKILNKSDNGALTITSDNSGTDDMKVRVQSWSDAAGQKWKSKQPLLAKSFEFKPTSNDQIRLDADSLSNVYARMVSGQDTKSWYVKDMGEGVFQIKNYVSGTCIASQGLTKPVKLMSCDNSPPQQWTFTPL